MHCWCKKKEKSGGAEGREKKRYRMAAVRVRVAYRAHPSPDARLSDEERQNSVIVTIHTKGWDDGRLVFPVARLVEAARRQLQVEDTTLQLSLRGLVLSPEEDVAGLMGCLPQGARDGLVFLLSPGAIEGAVEEEGEKDKQRVKDSRGGELRSAAKRVAFAPTLPSSNPVAETLPVDCTVMADPQAGRSLYDVECVKVGAEKSHSQCVFRESWLNPSRCVRCHCMRGQHSLFSPTRQQRMQLAMTPPKEKIGWKLQWTPPRRDHRFGSRNPSPLVPNLDSLEVADGERDHVSLAMPYYADPRQWIPRRDKRYRVPSVDACAEFFGSWGNPVLCAWCHRTRDVHQPDAIRPSPCSTHISPKRYQQRRASSENTKDPVSSPRRDRKACGFFVPIWNNNEYCSACYMRQESHTSRPQLRSPFNRVPASRPRSSPQQRKAPSVTDWLTTYEPARRVSNKKVDRCAPTCTTELKKARDAERIKKGKVVTSARRQHFSSLSNSSIPSTELATPQKALVFSAPPSVGVNSVRTTRPTTPTKRVIGSFSARDIPWEVVLCYITMEGLLTCKDVSVSMRTAAVPLIFANCKYIVETLDVPVENREVLVQCADLYASAIVGALRQKISHWGPFHAAKHPLRFLQYCIVQLFHALQAVGSEGAGKPVAREVRGRQCASITSPSWWGTASPDRAAVAIASRGITACKDTVEEERISSGDDEIDAVRVLIYSAARCKPGLLSQVAIQCIADTFEAISLVAAASLVHLCEEKQEKDVNQNAGCVRFMSLGEFLDKHAFMPLVEFLQAVEVVARMKWMAHTCLEKLHHPPPLCCSAG